MPRSYKLHRRVMALLLAFSVLIIVAPHAYAESKTVSLPALKVQKLRGEVITEDDLGWVQVPAYRSNTNVLRSKDRLIGMAAKRPIKPGAPIRSLDLEKPRLVKKGDLVTLVYKSGRLSLTARGKAMEAGARNETIRVLNVTSRRIFEARIAGPQLLVVEPLANIGLAQR
ncbi:MAG: flagellar basal body P-ring formation chaperone FlgA [Pseudomonadota bacterium]